MFRETLEKGKAFIDKIATVVMNYTPLEIKVREATNDEQWGPHGSLMNEIARGTRTYDGLLEIMNILWTRIFPENSSNWLRIYKGLVLLTFLLKNGSERVVEDARDHAYDLRTLLGYRCHDERGRDQGTSVRIKVTEVLELIEDSEFLRNEREKASSERNVFYGISSDNWTPTYESNFFESNNRFSDNYRFTTRHKTSDNDGRQFDKSWTDALGGDSRNPPKSVLGDFDSWKAGKERTLADNVTEKLSTALRAAKIVTNDFLGKPRVPPPSMEEDDPSVVSEDVFRFPNAIIDDDCVEYERIPNYVPSNGSSSPHFSNKKSTRTTTTSPGPTLIDLVKHAPTAAKVIKPVASIPRPPSCEIIATPRSPPAVVQRTVDLFDPFAEIVTPQTESLVSISATKNFHKPFHAGLLSQENDFGDFATATCEIPISGSQNALQWLSKSQANDTVAMQPLIPSTITTPSMVFATPQKSKIDPPIMEASTVGKTWQDLSSLNINLDRLAPNNSSKQTARPSLHELKNQQQLNSIGPLCTSPKVAANFDCKPLAKVSATDLFFA